jgi:PAS domain S-box-containing protein
LHTANLVVLGAWGFLLILTPFVPYSYLARMMVPWALPTLLIILTAGILSWRNGFQPARFFLFAWFGLIIPLAIVILVRIGAIPSTTWTENAYHIGVMWMAVSWSVALADRINLLKTEIENANRDLLNSRNRLAQILDGLPLGVVVYGRDSRPNFTNRRALEILGNPAQGIEPGLSAGRTLSQAMRYFSFRIAGSDEAYPLKKMPVQSALQGQADSADDIEADLVDKRVPLEIWASPVFDEAGDVDSAVVAFQDITLRRQAEESLRASKERFRVIVENVFDGIAFLDRDRTILYVSPSYKQLNGIDAEEMIGKSGAETVHPDDRTYVAAAFQRLLQQPGGRVSEEYRIRHKDGTWVWVETRVMNLLDDPRVGAIVLNSRDITQRKQSENALAEYRAHLEQLVETRTAELSATNEWLSMLKRIRQMVGGTADLPKVCDRLLTSILHLFDARLAFLLRWDDQGEHFEVEFLRGREDDSIKTPEELAFIVANMPPFRQELLAGEPVRLSEEEAESMPDEIRDLFQKHALQTIFLKPVTVGQSTEAVFGIVLQQPLQDITEAQVELIRTVGLDLFNLIEGAELLDRAQALLVAEERNSLARDLHDSVTQILFSASVLAESIPRLWDKDEAIARMNLEKLSVLLRGALADMRSLLFELRSDVPQGHSLEKLLIALVDSTRARTQLDFTLKVSHEPELPADVAQVFYRVAREAINNVVKHADATRVSITLFNEADCTELHIQDNGRGFNPREIDTEHMGLSIMVERAEMIDADLQIKSEAGHGSEVIVTWPGNGAEFLNDV